MGYPMTYRRVVNRNGLAEGGYDDKKGPAVGTAPFPGPERFNADVDYIKVLIDEIARRGTEIERQWNARRMLLGDLRRLETDTIDERTTCAEIARRSGIDPEIVAAVLGEFMQW